MITPPRRIVFFLSAFLLVLCLFAPAGLAFASVEQKIIRVDGKRLLERLEVLSLIGRNTEGGVDRVAFSEADQKAR